MYIQPCSQKYFTRYRSFVNSVNMRAGFAEESQPLEHIVHGYDNNHYEEGQFLAGTIFGLILG